MAKGAGLLLEDPVTVHLDKGWNEQFFLPGIKEQELFQSLPIFKV